MKLKRCEHGVLELNQCEKCLPYNFASKIGEESNKEPISILAHLTKEQLERVLHPEEHARKKFNKEINKLRKALKEVTNSISLCSGSCKFDPVKLGKLLGNLK